MDNQETPLTGCSYSQINGDRPHGKSGRDVDFQGFCRQLSKYNLNELKMMGEYFQEDLIHIMESVNTLSLLSELKSRTQLRLESYLEMKMQLGSSQFSKNLFQYIFDGDKEAITALFETLFLLKKMNPHPNLISLLDEIINTGETVMERIQLEKDGHSLCQELQKIQETHRKHLMRKTQNLVEHRPPRSDLPQKSFNISERFVNLVVVSTDTFRQRTHNELIDTGIKHEDCLHKAHRGLEFIAPSRLFCWCHRLKCDPNIVMVSGVPGVGKSTLLQKFVYDWVQEKLCRRFTFVFFFKFRDLNNLENVYINLEQMILREYKYLECHIDQILKDPEKLLFIFDGLDESVHKIDFNSDHVCTNPRYLENLGTIFVSLVRQVLLKGCSVLITSRPAKLSSMNTDAFQRIVEIMGFFNEERQMYFKHFFNNDEEQTQKVLNYVKQNDTLYTLCYIPSYCWIICTVLSKSFQPMSSDRQMLPKTMTQLLVTFVANILSNHSQDQKGIKELFLSIGKMAEYGVMNHILIYQERDLRSFNVDIHSQLLSSFVIESVDPPNVTFSFLHLIIQEFFAALVHYLDYSQEKLNKSLEDAISYKDCRGEIFLRFLCGLSDGITSSMLKSFFGELSVQASINVITWLRSFLHDVLTAEKYKGNKRKLLYVLFYLFETRNKALVTESLGSSWSFDFSGFYLAPLNCAMLAFILEASRETARLNLESCNINNDGLERLTPALHTVKDLSLSMNSLECGAVQYISSALSHSDCKIQKLNLGFSGLVDSSWSHLASAIRHNQSLRSLNLTSNKLEGPYFRDLAEALSGSSSKIKELNLSDTGLTDLSCSQLASLIMDNQSLRNIDLSYNRPDGPHFQELVKALSNPTCRIEELILRCNDLTSGSCSLLASVIISNPSLKKLDLSANNLSGPQFGDLMEALSSPACRIEELLLDNTGLMNSSFPQLASMVRDNHYLRKLDLSDNKLAGSHFCDFMEALSCPKCNIEELDLSSNGLTDGFCLQMASGIRHNQSLRKLDLSYNNLTGPHFTQLIDALSSPDCRIEQLMLHSIRLTYEFCPFLAKLSENANLTDLNLSNNLISDTCSTYIRSLILGSTSLKHISLNKNKFTDDEIHNLKALELEKQDLKISFG